MKYNVGQKIQIKKEIVRHIFDPSVVPEMKEYLGKIGEITQIFNVRGECRYLIFGWSWSEQWLSGSRKDKLNRILNN